MIEAQDILLDNAIYTAIIREFLTPFFLCRPSEWPVFSLEFSKAYADMAQKYDNMLPTISSRLPRKLPEVSAWL